jgi:triphosphoribosyl-dephospho-CoA synthase
MEGGMRERRGGCGQVAEDIMRSAQLAAALEVSGWPKPGNVHRMADFEDTTFEDFIAGSIALGPQIREASLMGIKAGLKGIDLGEVGVGEIIKRMLMDIRSWHRGGNTHLGTCLLFVPLSVSAGYTFARTSALGIQDIRRNVTRVMRATTTRDALSVQEAMELSMPAGLGILGNKKLPDLSGKGARRIILRDGFTLYDMMKASSTWDNIAREWTSGMDISFCCGFPTWMKIKRDVGKINTATVHTFLKILSSYPDTFIARKIGSRGGMDIEGAVRMGLAEATPPRRGTTPPPPSGWDWPRRGRYLSELRRYWIWEGYQLERA